MNAKTKTADPTDVVSNKTAVDTAAVQAQQTPAVAQLDKGSVKAPVPTTNAAGVPVAVAASNPSDDDLGEFAGMGNENVTRDNMATPFLVMLQSNSPQVKRLEAGYVPGAEEGMFFNTVTKKLYDGQAGLECINCFFEELVTRWKPRTQGGGFRGLMDPNDKILATLPRKKRDNGQETMTLVMPDGTEVNNIHQHYLLARPYWSKGKENAPGTEPGSSPYPWEPMVLGLSSTQIKKSRNLNAQINLQRLTLSNGRVVPAPRFATVWRLTAVAEKNADGAWVGVLFTPLRRVVRSELLEAKDFTLALASGRLRAVPTEETHPGDAGPRADGTNGAHAGPTMEGRARPLGDADLGENIPY